MVKLSILVYTIQCGLISETTGVDCLYEIPDILWDRIVHLLPTVQHKKKKKAGRPRMNDEQAVNGMHFLAALVHQVQYMIDFRNGGRLVYSSICGLMAC